MNKYKFIFFCLLSLMALLLLASCVPTDTKEIDEPLSPSQLTENSINFENEVNEAVQYLIECGIIENNKYLADSCLSRIVAVHIISDITGLGKEAEKSTTTHPFIDLSDKAEKKISFLYQNDIIDGVANDCFVEDDICDLDTFLVFLLRALNYIGGQQSTINMQNAREVAFEKKIITHSLYNKNDYSIISVNEALEICHNSLGVYINDEDTLLTYLCHKGIVQVPDSTTFNQAYQITGQNTAPFFVENFDDKKIDGYDIKSSNKIFWRGSRTKGADNQITDDGYLQMTGTKQDMEDDQHFALIKDYLQGNESYGMTFTVNIDKMGNEGNEDRVIFRVIPRTVDEDFNKYYAINYYMDFTMGDYESNLAKCKWSIINTNAPSGTEPLAEAYYLLKENVDYTAKLLIENTDDGNVHIEFYIDGADRYTAEIKPLLEYTDNSEYKILHSVHGPAFGNSGYKDFEWGFASSVRFDNVKLYDTQSFCKQTEQLKKFAATTDVLNEDDNNANQLKYLVNHGVIKPFQNNIDYVGYVSVAQFMASAMYLNGHYMIEGQKLDEHVMPVYQELFKDTEAEIQTDINRPITRYEAAQIINDMLPGKPATDKYHSLYSDELKKDYISSVFFAVENSYLLLDGNNEFNGDALLTRQNMLRIFSCAVDSGLRDKNYRLQIPSIISDNAILQRDKPIPISGRGMSGDTVTVKFNGQTKTAKVVNGEWHLELDSQPYGGPYDMIIEDTGYTYILKKLYVGEVFIVAGQSNAEWPLYYSDDNEDTLKKFNNQSQLRVFHPDSGRSTTPHFDTDSEWKVPNSPFSEYIIGSTSAIGVFFVQKLMEINPELRDIKIGIVQITYGGTSIELFLPDCVNKKNNHIQKDDEFIASGFWNGYMDAVVPYSAKALMFYQGENSTHLEYFYEPMLRDYIWGVRQAFGDSSLPVMLVQLTSFGENYGQDYDAWCKIREIQMRVANTIDNVGLVTAIDLSDEDIFEIHPTAKRPIGDRLAYLAMNMLYGQNYGMRSSMLTAYELSGHTYRLRFDAKELKLKQDAFGDVDFEVLNQGGEWVSAQAKIEGDSLLVWSEMVAAPKGVRYAWANYPKVCFFNEYDLPILPFNTAKDMNKPILHSDFTTDEYHLKKAYHLLDHNDAIINLTRNNEFRYVKVVNAYLVEYQHEKITGQAPGDQVILLKKQENFISESGTTQTIVKLAGHSLKAGDWIRNVKHDALAQVLEVIDENTVRVEPVENQKNGNVFEVYKNTGTVTAE